MLLLTHINIPHMYQYLPSLNFKLFLSYSFILSSQSLNLVVTTNLPQTSTPIPNLSYVQLIPCIFGGVCHPGWCLLYSLVFRVLCRCSKSVIHCYIVTLCCMILSPYHHSVSMYSSRHLAPLHWVSNCKSTPHLSTLHCGTSLAKLHVLHSGLNSVHLTS